MSSALAAGRVLVTGASGLIGSALTSSLRADGVAVTSLVRGASRGPDESRWSPSAGTLDPAALHGVSAVVHLAGAPIAQRWTERARREIRDSRVQSTALLSRAIAAASVRPTVFVSASAVGIYGDRGDETLDESSAPGGGFLASVCREWEAATAPAQDAGVRVVHIRTGLVLSPAGGMLQRLLSVFRMGAGGRLGSGRQWMSWIGLLDATRAIRYVLEREDAGGAVNLVGPNPVRNAEFTRTLARVLRRPALFPVPPVALRLVMGTAMTDEALLAGQRARPKRLLDMGFDFRAPTLESALRQVLTKSAP